MYTADTFEVLFYTQEFTLGECMNSWGSEGAESWARSSSEGKEGVEVCTGKTENGSPSAGVKGSPSGG